MYQAFFLLGVEEAAVYADQFKVHETSEDRKRQRGILARFAKMFGLRVWETGKFCRHDARMYSIKTGALVAFVESCYRNMHREWYPSGYGRDAAKIDKLFAIAEAHDVYGIHIVSWMGDEWFLNVTKALWEEVEPGVWEMADPWDTFWWKRWGRDEKPDLFYRIPHSWFKRVA